MRQQGLGLSELLIALFLSSLLMSLFVSLFIHQKKQYQTLMKRIERDEELYMSVDLMTEAIKMAGFSPCRSLQHLYSMDRRQGDRLLTSLRLDENQITITRMASSYQWIEPVHGGFSIRTGRRSSFKKKDAVIIADCYHAEVHQIDSIQTRQGISKIQLKEPLFFEYPSRAYIARFLEERWFIKKIKNQATLYYELNHHAEPWSEQISGMKIKKINRAEKIFLQLSLQPLTGHALRWTVMLRNAS